MVRRTLRGRWALLSALGTTSTTTTYPGFHISPVGVDHSRVFVPAMHDGWQFPSGWGDTLASRETVRVYLTAPKLLHDTSAYDEALIMVRGRHPDCIVISARDAFNSRRAWLEERERALAGVTQLYVLTPLDGRIGPGVGWELAFIRSRNSAAIVRALKALQLNNEVALSAGPHGDGYRVAGTWPEFSDPASWDAAPTLARIVFERSTLALISSVSSIDGNPTTGNVDPILGDHSDEGETAA